MANCLISTDNRSAQHLVCARSPPPRHLKMICPFLSTLVNEGILKGDVFTRAGLLNVTVAAGMEHAVALAHVSSNFKNEPSGVMNIFKMDGGTTEHKTSVGTHDCISVFSNCTMTAAGIQTCHNSTESCKLPLCNKFEDFWVRVDVNGDGKLTCEELATSAPRLPFNDANPIGEGTIEESHGFIITVFGDTEDEIGKAALERVFLDRRFPHGYKYPRGVASSLVWSVVLQVRSVAALANNSRKTVPFGPVLGLTPSNPKMRSSRSSAPSAVGRSSCKATV